MSRLSEITSAEASMGMLGDLTGVFEGIASLRIAQTKNQVLQSTKFFNELYGIYSQLRVAKPFTLTTSKSDRELYIIITAEGGLSGDIDQKLIQLMLGTYNPDLHDIICIGHHGAIQLAQRSVAYKKYFKLPSQDRNINVAPITALLPQYRKTTVFYQEYVSLMVQDVKFIELTTAIKQRAADASERPEDVISDATYIFEPSTYDVALHLEQSMAQIALSQFILQSKLAQYASRFRAMSASHQLADEAQSKYHAAAARARRAVKDERLKEVVNGLKKGYVTGVIS